MRARRLVRNRNRRSVRPALENLETRLAPATLTNVSGNILVIDLDNASENLQIASIGTKSYTLTSNHNFVDGGFGSDFVGYGTTTGILDASNIGALRVTDS